MVACAGSIWGNQGKGWIVFQGVRHSYYREPSSEEFKETRAKIARDMIKLSLDTAKNA